MDEFDVLKRRIEDLERRVNTLQGEPPLPGSELERAERRRKSSHTSRLVLGIIIVAVGLLWLGENYDIWFLRDLSIWPVLLIVFGFYLIFGER